MPETTEGQINRAFGPMAIKTVGWLAAAVGGAVLSMLLHFGAQQNDIDALKKLVDVNTQAITTLQTGYATNKRVDDLQQEVRSNYSDLSRKIDNVLTILIKGVR